MAAAEQLIEQSTRHQVYLERLKTGEANQWVPFLQEMDRKLRLALSSEDLTELSRTRMKALVSKVNALLTDIYERYKEQLNISLLELAEYEAGFEARSLNQVTSEDFEFVIPSPDQVKAAIEAHPLSVRGADGGKLLKPFINDWTSTEKRRVSNAIRQGFFEGKTTPQIIKEIRGTKAAKYKDGILAVTDRNIKTMVRTSVQHVASVARLETLKKNDIERYEWLSTLDNRTSQQCRSLDKQVFEMGKGPLPPLHPNCRSNYVAVLGPEFDFLKEDATRSSINGYVDADLSYYEWLKKEPIEVQIDAIGKTRAKLLNEGGISAKEFARLNLGKNFQPLTLDEMREKEPNVFIRAGL